MIVTNGGGLGVLATDALEARHGQLAPLSAESLKALDAVLPASWSRANPVDILGDAHGTRYAEALNILARDDGHDAILVMNCPIGVADNSEGARALAQARQAFPRMPFLACWAGGASLAEPQAILSAAGVPAFEAPEEAVRAFSHLFDYARNQRALLETPAAALARDPAAAARVNAIISTARAEARLILTEFEAKAVLDAYSIPITPTKIARDASDAARVAAAFGGRVAIKVLSNDITHKSDVGGVMLDLDPGQVEAAADEMLGRIAAVRPQARIDGFTVQPMIKRPQAQELIVGISVDPTFGPVILFGQGGVAVEIIADSAMALPPLNSALASDLIARTRVSKLLGGYRDRLPADRAAITQALTAVSDLAINHPDIAELDINPLLADADGVIALDARIVLAASAVGRPPLAIRPYPAALTHDIRLQDGLALRVRALAPSDAPALLQMGQRTSPQDLRLRFHGAVRTDSELGAARLCQIDYDREMALAAVESNGAIAGVARISFDPQFETGEFAILVRSDLQKRGIGRALLTDILAHAKSRGAHQVWGEVLPDNAGMLSFVRELSAAIESHDGGQRVSFSLTPGA
jgi:acetyltransferase